jgi:ABC-type phosphonate transport system ATPase subunit
MPLLECVGLVKHYRDKRAIDNVDFHVEQGEIVALVGREGLSISRRDRRITAGIRVPIRALASQPASEGWLSECQAFDQLG